MLMWAPVVEVLPGPAWFGTGAKFGYVVAVRLLESVLGNVFFWTGSVVYGVYETTERLWGMSPEADQATAGAVMMVEGLDRDARRARVALPARRRGGRAAAGAARAWARPARRAAGRPLRTRGGAARPALNLRLVPIRATGVDHVDICVSSIERSLPFYRELLAPLGYHRVSEVEGERGETIWYLSGAGASVGLREAQSPTDEPYDRYRIGLHHLAFEADSRSVVDERAEWLRDQGAELESEPQEYAYSPGYYAVFFYDPDGLKLELVHAPVLSVA